MDAICERRRGETVLFEAIEMCREMLTSYNFPNGVKCCICLYEFTDNDEVIKNDCFHHLHMHCFADYVISSRNAPTQQTDANHSNNFHIKCPVCRTHLSVDQF